jgi:dipeptidyl aminopeptidase/acylaminoacyl peptidase
MVAVRLACVLAVSILFIHCSASAAISPTMIVEMREITSVSVSPNGQLAVVGVCHPNPRINKRELSWVIVSLPKGRVLRTLDAGEEIYNPTGSATLLARQALWSRDSQWFFYLRRDGEEVQLWETRSEGEMTRQVTHSTSDLIDLKRSSDPDKFIVQLAPERAALRKAEDDEYRSGILYDDHIIGAFPLTRTLPFIDRWRSMRMADNGGFVPPGWSGRTSAIFDVSLRELKAAAGAMPTAFDASDSASSQVAVIALSPVPKDPRGYVGQYTLQLQPKTGRRPVQTCEIAECRAIRLTVIGWSPDGAEIYFLADSLRGPLDSRYPGGAALYAWNPEANAVRQIHDSGREGLWGRLYNLDARSALSIEPSPIVGRELVVAFAGADQPPLLEAIDLDSGVARILFDPNAELRALTRGRAIWRTWETSIGYSGRGIMILPDDYRPGEKYPAVITTYGCGNGFLRGGSGDNAPEFALAREGFIAICVDVRVNEIIAREPDQRRIYSIMCDIVLGVIADQTKDGKLDPTRVGLSGQSLGANAGTYCISHSNSFAAAAFRHGSAAERANWELFRTGPWSYGPDSLFGQLQLPDPRHDPTGRWDEISVSHRARLINASTLIVADDSEYLDALPIWSAMRDEGKAIEMQVLPDETHLLTQPVHMLANFERQIDWFKFWLNHEQDTAPSKRNQYDRWNRLRELTRNAPRPP